MDISAYQHMNIRISTRGKRPLRNLTPGDKVRAIQRIHNGETKASVSRDIGVPESTLRGWCKNEQKLRFMCRQLGTADHLNYALDIENPPEKRIRLSSHISSSPEFIPASNEFVYSRLPLAGLPLPSNDNNSLLEKMAINGIINNHEMFADHSNILSPNASLLSSDYTQLPLMQNLKLIPLLCPTTNYLNKSYSSESIEVNSPDLSKIIASGSSSITNSIGSSFTLRNPSNNDYSPKTDIDYIKNIVNKYQVNDTNNMKDKRELLPIPTSESAVNSAPIVELFQIQNITSYGSERSLIEWCKLFNANLNFMVLAAAASTIHHNTSPNTNISKSDIVRPLDNSFYKDCGKIDVTIDSTPLSVIYANCELSNDSYLDSEPEDLSVRSTTTSKIS